MTTKIASLEEVFVHAKGINYTTTGRDLLSQSNNTAWVYPEFAGYYGQLTWAALQTTEQPITVVTPTTNLFFLVLTPPALGNANSDTIYPQGTISLLHGISAIGDKFHVSGSSYAPSSAQNAAVGPYGGEADFFFGPVTVASNVPPLNIASTPQITHISLSGTGLSLLATNGTPGGS